VIRTPGIVGVVDTEKEDEIGGLLESMCKSAKHENWYKVDQLISPPLAIKRLHLGVLNPETQPIFNEDKTLCIFMDGEVYDYQKERSNLESRGHRFEIGNDPEFVLHLYEEYGKEFVEKLNGLFTIAIWDVSNRKLLIANDRYGLEPLYYAKNSGRFLFASELKAILQDRSFKKEINDEAVAEFFAFDFVLENKTFFKGIDLLPPASILTYQDENLSVRQYWDIVFVEECDVRSEDYYVEKLAKLMKESTERRMKGNYRFGIFLSGGLDSRSILATIDKRHYPIHTFTFGTPECYDAKFGQMAANKAGTTHHFMELVPNYLASSARKGIWLNDGMANCFHFFNISMLEEAKKHFEIGFDGCGCDITIGGQSLVYFSGPRVYLSYKPLLPQDDDALAKVLYEAHTKAMFTDKMMSKLFSQAYYLKIKGAAFKSLKRTLSKSKAKLPANKVDYYAIRNVIRTWALGPIRARSQLEIRMIAFDNDLFDFYLTMPPELRLHRRIHTKALKKINPDLAKIPNTKTGIRSDAPILIGNVAFLVMYVIERLKRILARLTGIPMRRKRSYHMMDEWMRSELREWTENILLDENTLKRGHFNKGYVNQLIRDHMSGKKDYSRQLLALVTYEIFQRLFVDV